MKGHSRVQKAIDGQTFGLEIDPKITAEKQVGLPRLDGDARSNPARVEIPLSGSITCSVTTRPACSDRRWPSMDKIRSTSIKGSSGSRTLVG